METATVSPFVPTEETRKFHVGTKETAPFFNIVLGGICFPRVTQKVRYDEEQKQTHRNERIGVIQTLTPEQQVRLEKAIENTVAMGQLPP